jgi:hypothetical protein
MIACIAIGGLYGGPLGLIVVIMGVSILGHEFTHVIAAKLTGEQIIGVKLGWNSYIDYEVTDYRNAALVYFSGFLWQWLSGMAIFLISVSCGNLSLILLAVGFWYLNIFIESVNKLSDLNQYREYKSLIHKKS